jgi:hypothetical protein
VVAEVANLGEVGPSDRDEPGPAVARRELGVVGGDPAGLLQEPGSGVVRITRRGAHPVLHQERHAAKRPFGQLAGRLSVGLVEAAMDHRVDLAVVALDARDRRVDELERRHLPELASEERPGGRHSLARSVSHPNWQAKSAQERASFACQKRFTSELASEERPGGRHSLARSVW